MRKLLLYLVLLAANISCNRPSKLIIKTDCDFLNNLTFKNGKATVVVKAFYTEFFRSPQYGQFTDMEKNKLLDREKYFRVDTIEGEGYMDVGSAIMFVPENCDRPFGATVPLSLRFDSLKFGQIINVKCIAFEGLRDGAGKPFFVVDEVTYDGKDLPGAQDIRPLEYININDFSQTEGISYFSDDGEKLMDVKCLLAVFWGKKAVISIANHENHIFNFQKRILNQSGYTETYKNRNEADSIQLSINCEKRLSDHSYLRIGELTAFIKGKTHSIKVYGD